MAVAPSGASLGRRGGVFFFVEEGNVSNVSSCVGWSEGDMRDRERGREFVADRVVARGECAPLRTARTDHMRVGVANPRESYRELCKNTATGGSLGQAPQGVARRVRLAGR